MKKIVGAVTLKIMALIIIKDIIESVADLFFKNATLSTGINNIILANLCSFAAKIVSK